MALLHSCTVTRKNCWPPVWEQGANTVLRQSFSHGATQERPGCKIHIQCLSFWPNRSRAVAQVGIPEEALGRKEGNRGKGVNGRTCHSIATWRLDKRDSDDTTDWAPVQTIKLGLLRRNATVLQVHGKKKLVHTFRRNIFRLLGQDCCPAIFWMSKECTQLLSHERPASKSAHHREFKNIYTGKKD